MNVAIVDDDEETRLCFKDIILSTNNFSLAGSFSNANDALADIPRLKPDLTLMDVRLPDLNGVECAKRLMHVMPDLKVILITGTNERNWASASLHAGAIAFLVKPIHGKQLVATLRFAAADQDKTGEKFKKIESKSLCKGAIRANLPLSSREKEVLAGLAEGLLYKEIASKLHISYSAVHKYQHNIFKKLQITNRSEAIRLWLENRNR